MVQLAVQLDGKHVTSISVSEDAGRSVIETLARNAVKKNAFNSKIVLVPGKLVNVLSNTVNS